MHHKGILRTRACLNSLVVTMLIAACSGCLPRSKPPPPVLGADTAEPKPVMATNKPPSVAETGFYAACGVETPGAHVGPWTGPLRAERAEAVKDAQEHNQAHRGHRATVLEY